MSTEIVKSHAPEPASPRVSRALIVADALQQEADQRKLLGEYVRSHMVEGTDYGVIPGTKVKTLLKPGAEKLTQLYRCIPRFVIEEKIENWDSGLFYYRFSCQIVTQADDAVVAEGVGSCSTYESRYRWRKADRKCPACGAEAILRSKYPPKDDPDGDAEPGWYCFAKKGGCGAQFDAHDPSITEQPAGRVQNPDLLDQVNTVLKMAKKRALVDAAIALARCSDIFTQDVEDAGGGDERPAAPAKSAEPSRKHDPKALCERFVAQIAEAATEAALKELVADMNAAAKRGLLGKPEIDRLTPLVSARKAQLQAPAQPPAQPTAKPEADPVEPEPVEDAEAVPAEPKTMPGSERRTTPAAAKSEPADGVPPAGRSIIEALLAQMHELGVNWAQIRDGVEKGEEIAVAAALPKMPVDFRINQLSAVEAGRLHAELKARVEKKRANAEKRAKNAEQKAGAAS